MTKTFTTADQNTVLACVKDGQVLLNNIRNDLSPARPDILTDGLYGSQTQSDVHQFQVDIADENETITIDGKLGPQTWWWLCANNTAFQFQGSFWHDAGCATEGSHPPA